MKSRRIPQSIQPILEKHILLTNEKLPHFLCGFYVVGSIALDGFNAQFSDIDFVAVLQRRANPADIKVLTAIHETLERNFPKWKLSGCYLHSDDLGCFEHEIDPHPYYHDGKFHAKGYFEINSVTWWILKNHGIAILGTEAAHLPFTVNWDILIARMKENLNSYWVSWTRRPDRMLMMLSDWGIQWAVLGVLRQYYTFQKNSITTKTGAAHYALTCFPSVWHPVIQEAINIRDGRSASLYSSKILRMMGAVRFLKHVIQRSNTEFP